MKKEAPKNGPYTEYYENGQKESEEYYKDGECISGDCWLTNPTSERYNPNSFNGDRVDLNSDVIFYPVMLCENFGWT